MPPQKVPRYHFPIGMLCKVFAVCQDQHLSSIDDKYLHVIHYPIKKGRVRSFWFPFIMSAPFF